MNAEQRRLAAEAFAQSETQKLDTMLEDTIIPRWAIEKWGPDEVVDEVNAPNKENEVEDEDDVGVVLSDAEIAQLYGDDEVEYEEDKEWTTRSIAKQEPFSSERSKIPEPRIRPKRYSATGGTGYVYVASNPFFYTQDEQRLPLYKIGHTLAASPYERLASLSNSSLPTPFEFEMFWAVRGAESLERALHSELREFRYCGDREFFCVDLSKIKEVGESLFRRNLWRCDGVFYGPNLI